jgi:hypothetical protein
MLYFTEFSTAKPTILGLLYTVGFGLSGTISPLFGCQTTLASSLKEFWLGKCRAKTRT